MPKEYTRIDLSNSNVIVTPTSGDAIYKDIASGMPIIAVKNYKDEERVILIAVNHIVSFQAQEGTSVY